MTNLESVPYSFIPKLYGLMDTSNLETTGVSYVRREQGLNLTGKDVIVGVVDTGIQYTNPLFLGEDGKTRIGVIWDQTIKGPKRSEGVPEAFFGSVYSAQEIDLALQQENPYEIVPSRDEDGHGTFLTGVAAGAVEQSADFSGIAPDAELAIIKLKEAKPYLMEYFGVPQTVLAYQETDIIYGVQYLMEYAKMKEKPISILIGLGTNNGNHDGNSFLEGYLDTILENLGIMVSVPAGNEGNARLHYSGNLSVDTEYEQVELNVDDGQDALVVEFWGDSPTTFSMGIVSPQGDRIERIPPRFGQEELLFLPGANTVVYIAYQLVEVYSGMELIFLRLINPAPGIWSFLIYGEAGRQRSFNIWLPLRQFLRPDTYFLRPEPENTITIPGNAKLVMTMTAYNHLNGSIFAESGRGYLPRQEGKPDLAAPGVDISGPGLLNNIVRRSGTSVAAAHSAGMMALFLQWNKNNPEVGRLYAAQIQSLFLKNALREPQYEYPNVIWGYGVMNIESVFRDFQVIPYPQGPYFI